jgi:hypothetical protein
MLRRLGKADGVGFKRRCLGEPAKTGEGVNEPTAIVDRCRCDVSEGLVDPVGGQRRQVFGGQLDHSVVVAPEEVRLLEIGCGDKAQPQVAETPRDLEGAGAGNERLVQLAKIVVSGRHEGAHASSPAVVVQPFGERLGLAQPLQRQPDLTELSQHFPTGCAWAASGVAKRQLARAPRKVRRSIT